MTIMIIIIIKRKLRKVQIVPVIVGALGSVTNGTSHYKHDFYKTTALLGTARILRKVLDI